jgi:hypothetical protein
MRLPTVAARGDSAAPEATSTRRPRTRAALLVLLGLAVVQAVWICVVAPFGGADEIDHAYRADATAHGEFLPDYVIGPGGRGELIAVRESLVVAARPECEALALPAPDKCHPVERLDDGRVLVASSAARYNPVFYAVVGTAARPFDGTAALYAMRACTALICILLLTWACLLAAGRPSRWPAVAVVLAMTPVVTYSASVAAPNGVELCAALLTWSAGLALVAALRDGDQVRASTITALTVGLVLVGGPRTLGPLWVLIIVGVLLLLAPSAQWVAAFRSQPRRWATSVGLVIASCAAGAAWTLVSGANRPALEGLEFERSPFPGILIQPIVWLVQSIGVFPLRDEFAPWPVYALVLAVWGALLFIAPRTALRRERIAVVAMIVGLTALPLCLTLLTYRDLGFAWQGRYTWTAACGVLFILAESCRGDRSDADRVLLPAVLAMSATVHVLSQRSVQTGEAIGSAPSAAVGGLLVPALSVLGFGLVWLGVAWQRRDSALA